MSLEGESLLKIEALEHAYSDGTRALRGIDLSLPPRGRLALVGPNGSGKTTLLMHLNGLLLPTSGRIGLDGFEIGPSTVRRARETVGLLFQDPEDQLFMPTLAEDVAFGPLNLGSSHDEAHRRASRALADVGLAGKEERPPQALSGGQKRLAALAGLLAMNPVILALDEPTSGLDPRGRRVLEALLRDLPAALLIASHDLEFCLALCDQAVVLDEGSVVRRGPICEVFSDREFMEAHGLEKPHSLDHIEGGHTHIDDAG